MAQLPEAVVSAAEKYLSAKADQTVMHSILVGPR
jgi:hypothetical protein